MGYTLGQAAKATRKSKSTISKAIKERRLSAEKNVDGHYDIDPSELHRVWPKVFDEPSTEPVPVERVEPENAIRINQLETELKSEREKSAGLADQVADLRADRTDQLRRAAKASQRSVQ